MGWRTGRESGSKRREGDWGREMAERMGKRGGKENWSKRKEWQTG